MCGIIQSNIHSSIFCLLVLAADKTSNSSQSVHTLCYSILLLPSIFPAVPLTSTKFSNFAADFFLLKVDFIPIFLAADMICCFGSITNRKLNQKSQTESSLRVTNFVWCVFLYLYEIPNSFLLIRFYFILTIIIVQLSHVILS